MAKNSCDIRLDTKKAIKFQPQLEIKIGEKVWIIIPW
jgi:hypothetical protein